jgi:hypothetical protein
MAGASSNLDLAAAGYVRAKHLSNDQTAALAYHETQGASGFVGRMGHETPGWAAVGNPRHFGRVRRWMRLPLAFGARMRLVAGPVREEEYPRETNDEAALFR